MSTVKVVYNGCFGGFSVSLKAAYRLRELGVLNLDKEIQDAESKSFAFGSICFYDAKLTRHDPRLVQVVEELGKNANGGCASLRIEEISGNRYRIDEYDGRESVVTPDEAGEEWITV